MTKIKKDSPLAKVLGDLGYDNSEAGESVSNMDDESDFKEPDQDTVTDVDNLDKEEDKIAEVVANTIIEELSKQ